MATETRTPGGKGSSGKFVEYDQFIETQLRKTRSQVRNVDIAGELMVLIAGTLAFFLATALVDHWMFSRGLGFFGRSLFFILYLAGAGYYSISRLGPLVLRRINPIYAAHTIECSKPSLKNSLVNFLLLRQRRAELPAIIFDAVEEQAATNLAKVPLDTAVDRSKLIKIGYVLLGVLLACAVYKMASPKDPFQTVGRVVMPWSDIQPATRVSILDVQPGATTAFTGQQIAVSAELRGLSDQDAVRVLYTTADAQTVDQPIEMHVSQAGYRYTATLPAGESGLQQDLKYRIAAGDAVSKEYRISVVSAPTIVVESLDYQYPQYTGFLDRHVEHEGDIKGIEGTQVTVHAIANQEIASAYVDFDCDGTPDERMTIEGRQATAKFVLALDKDRKGPEHATYQVHFKTGEGQESLQPLRYQIEVTPDLPPTIEFLAPAKEDLELPVNRSLRLALSAADPDFALRQVKLVVRRGDQQLVDKQLLAEEWHGRFQGKYQLEPAKLGLKNGDKLEYWGVAEDNKSPRPNHVETVKRRLTIVSPDNKQPNQLARAERKPDKPDDSSQGRGDSAAGQRQKNNPEQPKQDEDQQTDKQQQPGDDAQQDSGGAAGENGKSGDENQQKGGEGGSEGGQGEGGQQGDKQSGLSQDNPAGQGQEKGSQNGEQGAASDNQSGGSQQKSGAGGSEKSSAQSGKDGGSQQKSQPVAKDGENDGDAFERILQHLQNDKQDSSGKQGQQQGGGDKQQPKNGQRGEPAANQEQPAGETGSQGDQAKGKPDARQKPRDPSRGDQQSETGDASGDRSEPGQKGRAPNQKAQPEGGEQPQADAANPGSNDQQSQGSKDDGQQHQPRGGDKQPGGSQQGDASKDGQESQGGKGDPKQKSQPGAKSDKQARPDSPAGERSKPDAAEQSGDPDQAERGKQQGEKSADQDSQPDNPGPSANKRGRGDKSQGAQGGQKQSSGDESPDATGGEPNEDKGDSGAGQQSKENDGAPSPQDDNVQRNGKKPGHPDKPDSKHDEGAQSPSRSKKQSDSEGGQAGDLSGGGKPGGGQKANQPGTGGSGQNTASDEGAGKSDEAGDGETSNEPGSEQTSEKPTGKPGSEKGAGSSSREGSGESGGETSKSDGSDQQQVDNTRRQKARQAAGDNGNGEGGSPGGSDVQGKTPPPPSAATPTQPDDPNLDYARKATDLALERLKNQLDKNQVDQKLLDKLGWSRDDLERFVKRWEEMRRQARQGGTQGQAARKELDESLRSLGLAPRGATLKAGSHKDDQVRGLKESRRTRPPADYAEQSEAYSQGKARGGK